MFRARIVRDQYEYKRAVRLVRKAVNLKEDDQIALSILCSVLREIGKPRQAIKETNIDKSIDSIPLLTSRAAAYCDLEEWETAKAEIAKALNKGENPDSFNVVNRIKKARPDLY